MNKRNKYLLIVLIVCAAILVFEIVWTMMQKTPENINNETQFVMESTSTMESLDGQAGLEDQEGQESQESQESQRIPDVSEETGANRVTDTTEPTEHVPNETNPSEKPGGTNRPQNNTVNFYDFPYSIPGSGLVIEQINSYDGLFFEDGSDKEVSNVTAMVITNTGEVCAEYFEISIERSGVKLQFAASALESGGTMIVLEADGKQFSNGTYSNCVATVATMEELTMSENQVRVEETAEGSLLVTNITETDIPCIRIFYKFYMYDTNVYVGGITYTAKVTNLAAGASCIVTPSHYLQGYSKIIMVKTYDTEV